MGRSENAFFVSKKHHRTVAGNLQRMSTGTMQGFSSDATLAPAYPARQAAPKAAAKKDDIWSPATRGLFHHFSEFETSEVRI